MAPEPEPDMQNITRTILLIAFTVLGLATLAPAQIAVRGKVIHTMAGDAIENGTILIRDGKIAAIGAGDDITVPEDFKVIEAEIVTPGLVDAHSVVGLTGMLNQDQDQDQLEHSSPIQPALRAIDAYNGRDELIDWIRSFGVTTVHTGHAPGELISGQTMVVKTTGGTLDESVLIPTRALATTLSTRARKSGKESPGTRAKMLQMLRAKLIAAQEYRQKRKPKQDLGQSDEDDDKKEKDPPSRDLNKEALAEVLNGKTPLLITAHRAQDITNALRLAKEFEFKLWLDGAAESYLLIDEIKAAKVPVILHPSMARATGDLENSSFETASKLVAAGIPVGMQSGYEAYVPKTRVVLFEAALTAANGLTFDQALATITIEAAKILDVQDRVGSIEVGKDGDLALYDGDPFEYTTHCVGTIIDGKMVSESER